MYQKRTKRSAQAKRTRQALYESASRLFAEKGFHAVTVEELCQGAGVSTGAFYHHFKSKMEILAVYHESLDDRYLRFYEEKLNVPANRDVPVPEKLRELLSFILRTCVDLGADYERVVYSNILSSREFSKSMVDPSRNYFRIISELLEEGQRRGEITGTVSAQQMMADITMLCRGCIVDWCINDGQDDIAQHAASFIRCYIDGIRPEEK